MIVLNKYISCFYNNGALILLGIGIFIILISVIITYSFGMKEFREQRYTHCYFKTKLTHDQVKMITVGYCNNCQESNRVKFFEINIRNKQGKESLGIMGRCKICKNVFTKFPEKNNDLFKDFLNTFFNTENK